VLRSNLHAKGNVAFRKGRFRAVRVRTAGYTHGQRTCPRHRLPAQLSARNPPIPLQRSTTVKLNIAIAALGIAGLIGTAHAQDPNLARNLAATCANCHGTNGKSLGGMESLAGEPKEKLLQKLADYRSGDKPATIMHQIVTGYTDEQIDLITTWFAAQK
jgi:cytochrome c553